jgi:fructose-bisphosphate aldolase class 1
MNTLALIATARMRVGGDKRPPAMDDGKSTCNKRFTGLGISQTEEVRDYRELTVITVPAT